MCLVLLELPVAAEKALVIARRGLGHRIAEALASDDELEGIRHLEVVAGLSTPNKQAPGETVATVYGLSSRSAALSLTVSFSCTRLVSERIV